MKLEIKIPSPGESITEVELASWQVNNGDYVVKDQELAEIESDKATLPLLAEKAGKIKILIEAGSTVKIGEIACVIDTDAEAPPEKQEIKTEQKIDETGKPEEVLEKVVNKEVKKEHGKESTQKNIKITPLAKKLMEDNNLIVDDIIGGLRKITTKEVNMVISSKSVESQNIKQVSREVKREKVTQLRKKISERLVSVKNQTAMLTTFNEVDMSEVIRLRKKYQKSFLEKYGVKLGFMSFLTKAVNVALQSFPKINSHFDNDEIIVPEYYDIGIAVQTEKGLMVPILRNVEVLGIAEIELMIADVAAKARKFRLSPQEMSGGTFTITNGGVFGSLLSTPILNPPQSGILGMHNIVERPVAIEGQVVVRPMMYIALSYDHRIVDGKDSVSFLMKLKELIESPHKLMYDVSTDIEKELLGL